MVRAALSHTPKSIDGPPASTPWKRTTTPLRICSIVRPAGTVPRRRIVRPGVLDWEAAPAVGAGCRSRTGPSGLPAPRSRNRGSPSRLRGATRRRLLRVPSRSTGSAAEIPRAGREAESDRGDPGPEGGVGARVRCVGGVEHTTRSPVSTAPHAIGIGSSVPTLGLETKAVASRGLARPFTEWAEMPTRDTIESTATAMAERRMLDMVTSRS